jgi:hypothetical protein
MSNMKYNWRDERERERERERCSEHAKENQYNRQKTLFVSQSTTFELDFTKFNKMGPAGASGENIKIVVDQVDQSRTSGCQKD